MLTHLFCRCFGTWFPPQQPPEAWASWLQLQPKVGPGVTCTRSFLLPWTHVYKICYPCLHCLSRKQLHQLLYLCHILTGLLMRLYYLLMPLTSSDAHGWCMLRHQPPSDISCSSLSWSRSLWRSSPPLFSPKLASCSTDLLCLLLPPTSTHYNV